MKLFENMSEQEQISAMDTFVGRSSRYIRDRINETLSMLHENPKAYTRANKIASGNYAVYTPQEIAKYCIEWAEGN